jgi:uncharacterized protein (DUF58 family)
MSDLLPPSLLPASLLPASRMAQLRALPIRPGRTLVGSGAGAHRSPRRGLSIDFADHRPYAAGDDIRRIDHHVWARLDQLALKRFDAEEDLSVRMLVDTSTSMRPKRQRCAELAAALGFLALEHRDVASIRTFSGPPRTFTGRRDVGSLLAHLDSLDSGGITDLGGGVRRLLGDANRSRSGLNVILSDLLAPGWADALRLAPARGAAVAVVHVVDRNEVEPDLSGDLELVDAETGERVSVSLDPLQLAKVRSVIDGWLADVERACVGIGARYVRAVTDEPVDQQSVRVARELTRT